LPCSAPAGSGSHSAMPIFRVHWLDRSPSRQNGLYKTRRSDSWPPRSSCPCRAEARPRGFFSATRLAVDLIATAGNPPSPPAERTGLPSLLNRRPASPQSQFSTCAENFPGPALLSTSVGRVRNINREHRSGYVRSVIRAHILLHQLRPLEMFRALHAMNQFHGRRACVARHFHLQLHLILLI